jgi:predicted CXXCH cytochrome family protein
VSVGPRRGRRLAAAARALAALGACLVAGLALAEERVFPHFKHAKLFVSCAACHGAIADSVDPRRAARGVPRDSQRFPSAELCAECHDERERPISPWRGPTERATNLAFAHDAHARAEVRSAARPGAGARAADSVPRADCASCHSPPGETRWMAVARAQPEACVGCHAHRATAHLADDAPCATCHLPLVAATGLSAARVAGLPRPPSHDAPDFIRGHGRRAGSPPTTAQCATCHAVESCARCHMNALALPSVAALGRDARVAAAVAGRRPSYPAPRSHADPSWPTAHGGEARRATATCANCHAQRSCATCHLGSGAASVIARLPAPRPGVGAQGVQLRGAGEALRGAPGDPLRDADLLDAPSAAGTARVPSGGNAVRGGAARGGAPHAPVRPDTVRRDTARTPRPDSAAGDTAYVVRVHPSGFAREHDAAAGTQSPRCASCHVQRFCASCHAGEGRRRFHPPDFALRHAPAAYGRERDCQSCHSPEAFCRSCHVGSGLASRGRRDVAFHDAQPQWLVQHGRAARQGLESCTSCHAQRDCMQCHSSRGLRVSPHGPGFDPRRMAARSRVACIACHGRDPLAGR